jgi:hypothetical protein
MQEAKHSWAEIFFDTAACFRFVAAILLLFVILGLFAKALIYLVKPERLSFNEKEGTIEISGIGQHARGLTMLPASVLWVNTGIRVHKGQALSVKTSGRVNLAIHRLVQSAQEGGPLHHGWVGPDGEAPSSPVYESRTKLLVDPNANIGCVLGYIKPDAADDPGRNNPRPPGMVKLAGEGEITGDGTLWLTVNDYVVTKSDEMRDAYTGTPEILSRSDYTIQVEKTNKEGIKYLETKKASVPELKDRWDGIVNSGNLTTFFQDNVGEFLVEVTVRD